MSSALNNYLTKNSLLRGVGLAYNGAFATKLNLTFGYKDVVLNADAATNATGSLSSSDFSVEIPFSTFLSFPDAHKFLFMGESHLGTDPFSQTLVQQPLFLGRFLFRISQ